MSKTTIGHNEETVTAEWARLLASLIPEIGDEYRAFEDSEEPSMLVTFGLTRHEDGSLSWGWQSRDTSFMGGAHSHPAWGSVALYRDSVPAELAKEAMDEALDTIEAHANGQI